MFVNIKMLYCNNSFGEFQKRQTSIIDILKCKFYCWVNLINTIGIYYAVYAGYNKTMQHVMWMWKIVNMLMEMFQIVEFEILSLTAG